MTLKEYRDWLEARIIKHKAVLDKIEPKSGLIYNHNYERYFCNLEALEKLKELQDDKC